MSGAAFLLGINMSVAGLLACAFWAAASWSVRPQPGRLLALSYALGAVYYALEFLIPFMALPRPGVVAAFSAMLAATAVFTVGLATEFTRRPPWRAIALLAVVAPVVVYVAQDWPRQSFPRMFAYQAPYAIMLGVCLMTIWPAARRRGGLGIALLGILFASALHFLAKPIMAHALGGWGSDPTRYLQSGYAIVSQSTGTVLAFATALCALAILVKGALESATAKSEVDNLSGLLNRRGFERAAAGIFDDATSLSQPLALIVADIDHFKSINDRFGHAAGDQAIRTFAALLETAAGGHVIGRTGGEEFVIVLKGADLMAARMLAEGARSAFSHTQLTELDSEPITASFGVAERARGESLSDVMRRADLALYDAKRAGRDCVRTAPYLVGLARDSNTAASVRGFEAPVAKR
jgi:diguanylate cyclase (GGDEF)-like protein